MGGDSDHQLASLWQEAIERYALITGVDLRTDPSVIRVTSGDDLMNILDTQQAQFVKFRERKAMLWKVLGQIARGVETLASIASDGISQAFPPSGIIFASVSYLIKGAKNVGAAYESIIKLLEVLRVFITRISLHTKHSILPELREIFVRKLSCFLVIFGLSAKLIKDGRALRFVKNILQGGDSSGLQAQINELETLSKHETDLIRTLSLTAVYEQSATLSALATDITANSIALKRLAEIQSPQDINEDVDVQLRMLKEHLNPELSVEADFDNINNDLLPGTGDWILSDATFQEWFDGSASSLWVSGGPGQGKTYLSARVIRQLMEDYPQEVEHASRTSISYFLCRDTNKRTQLFSVILRTLAYQIARNDFVYRAYLLNTLKTDSGTRAGTAQSWEVLFGNFFANNDIQSRVFIVIDGLDEATREGFEGVETFLESLRLLLLGFRNNPSPRLKVILVGRPEMDGMIYDILGSLTSTIELSGSHESDVVKYIKNQLSRARNLRKVSPAFREEIMEKLSERAFLWVKLVCKEIASKNRESQMRATLDAFPQDLRATIHHVLERFSENNADDIADLNELLAWVTCARRPLTLGEMEVAMAMNSSTCEPILELERLLRKHYSTFFTLTRKDGLGTADLQNKSRRSLGDDISTSAELNNALQEGEDDGEEDFDEDVDVFDSPKDTTVHISHLVFLEYFRSQGQTTAVGVDVAKTEVHLLLRCLELLCDEEKAERWKKETMVFYARQHWMSHLGKVDVNAVSVEDKRSVAGYLHRLFTDDAALVPWWGGLNVLLLAQALFETDATTDAIIRWVTDDDIEPGEIREWAEAIKADPQTLFAAAIKLSSDKWLRDYWDAFSCFRLIYAYMHRFKLYPEGSPFTSGLSTDLTRGAVAYDDVLTVINWIGSPEESFALARIGRLLRDLADFDHAEEWYLKATAAADPPVFPATCGLARTYYLKPVSDYKKAVEWGRRALENYEAQFTEDAHALAQEIAEWMSELHDADEATLDEALAQWEVAFEPNSRKPTFVLAYLEQLAEWQHYEQVISVMKTLANVEWNPPEGVTHSFLVEIIHAHAGSFKLEALQRAARDANDIPWLVDVYKTALTAAANLPTPKPGLTAGIQFLLGSVMLDDSVDEDYAIELFEAGLSDLATSKTSSHFFLARGVAISSLGEVYYERAVKAEKNGEDPIPYIAKLTRTAHRQYSQADDDDDDKPIELLTPVFDFLISMVHSTDLLLGMWYRLHGQENEAAPIFRQRISFALDLLHDDIKANDDSAYELLAFALIAAGDLRGCLAAMHLIGGPVLDESLRTWRTETEDSEIDESYKAPKSNYVDKDSIMLALGRSAECDGPCKRDLFIPHGVNVCMGGCLMTTFCSPCLGKLKRGELKYRVCSPDHHWLYIAREGLPDLEEGKVLFVADGEELELTMDLEEWFTQLKKKWGIETN